ncbi:Pineal opsin [Nibea albiflora]|uniref:Pineal opsin n=1 Tax=Nibea albiflora TaxID=240163 RepID=A0ACB7FIG2_NIBAL|nr:Pineal opsin [Nibea albiflora]
MAMKLSDSCRHVAIRQRSKLRNFVDTEGVCQFVSGINSSMSRKREQRVLFMVVIMVICYLLCWLPYGIMALLATFGPPGFVTPEASIIPSVFAKTSTVINPVIYVFMNKQFYRCFQGLLRCEPPRRGSSVKSSSRVATKPVRGLAVSGPRRTNNFLCMVASLGRPVTTVPQLGPSFEATNDVTKAPSSDTNKPVMVSLEAHFDG